MKNNYILIYLLFVSSVFLAQNNDFNNGGGDLLWSNSANWSLGVVPNVTNTGQVRLLSATESLVNTPITIKKIQNTFGTTVSTPLGGASILTIDPGVNNGFGFDNVSNSDVNMIFNGSITINNSASGTPQTLMRNQNGNTNDLNSIIFGDGSTLTLTTNLELRTGSGGDNFNFNGTLAGSAALRISANTTATFGSTTNNTGFAGSIVYIGNPGLVVVNAADDNVFMPSGQKIQVNATGGEVELNGANVYQGNVTVGGTNTFTMDLNKNQNSMGAIILSASGTLNLDVDSSVTGITFADNSGSAWNTGTVNITGFKDGVLRFGTDGNGLTSSQLSQITVDDSSNGLFLDANGYLYSYDTSWTGATNTDWETAGNWSHGVPTSGQDILVSDVANAPVIGSSTNVTLDDLVINETDGLTISSGGALIVNGASSGNVIYNRTLTAVAGNTNGWHLIASPVAGQTFNNNYATANDLATSGSNRGLASYNDANASGSKYTYLLSDDTNTSNFNSGVFSGSGVGYSAKRANTGTVAFTGTINTTDVNGVSVSTAGNGFNLLGVPYTAYISSQTFLNDNAGLDQNQIWVWKQDNSSGGNFIAMTAKADNFILAPGQGFFVKVNSGSTVNFSESNQTSNADTFQKSSKTELKILMTDGTNNRFAKVYYASEATKGFDYGWEGEVFGGIPNSLDVFTNLVDNNQGKKYQVQTLPKSELESMVIPVGVVSEAGKELTFSLESTNFPSSVKVYLEDRVNNTFNEISNGNSFKVTQTEISNDVGRFYLHTSSAALSIDTISLEGVSMYTLNENMLKMVGLPNGESKVKIYNILGKQVLNTSFTSKGTKELTLPRLVRGVYIVELESESKTLNKKIILK